MSLRVYNDHHIHIINRYTHIEIHFRGDCKDSCQSICKLVTKAIKKSRKDLNVDDDHIFAFKCPQNKQCYCIVQKDDKSSTWYSHCTLCETKYKVLERDNSYKCWFFSDSPSLGAKPSLEGPPTKIKSTELLETKASSEDPLISILKLSASDRFRDASDRLAGSILSCLVTVSLKLNARRLISQELHKEMITGRDNDVIKAAKLVLAIQTTLDAQANPETYLNDVCSALKELGEKQVTDIVNGLEQSKTD
ncbi:PREDICTED: uncharacterized protein LOC109588488 [Amphimedon queenslandica]|uniref:Uncharacterized protein n=1 Tax=Amphimedon queenslandica TaxID=400682 RepID=A0AAN0JSW0_AMPQE|nr:PREDICTED: uncharacterized protein LOC109588488 [Amphimedon queenslandica]|eukprot:XP_019860206.1 PREDICTED: uncharacterized protein LOC109588488 [Amphimedon queenslandica]